MVTASHNPPMDNGYKVYDRRRRADRAADRRRDLGRDRRGRTAGRRAARRRSTDPLVHRHRARAARRATSTRCWQMLPSPEPLAARPVVVYSAMHGVGGGDGRRAARPGRLRSRRCSVAEQFEPDPDFPTVAFPNPEEPGAMDLSLADGGAGRRRRRGGQRPRRRPAGGGDPATAPRRLADAPGRRGRRAARRRGAGRPAGRARGPGRAGARAGLQPRVVAAARSHGRRRRDRLRGDAHRVQVDRPRAGTRAAPPVRLRGGARLLRRRPRRRQGRHQRPAGAGAPRSPRSADRAPRWPTGSTSWPGATASTPPARCSFRADGHRRAGPHRRRPCAGCGRHRRPRSAGGRSSGSRTSRRRRPAGSCRRATCWCCTSTAPASSSARAAPSRSSSATSRWSCPVTGEVAEARTRADQALDEVAAAMTALLGLSIAFLRRKWLP